MLAKHHSSTSRCGNLVELWERCKKIVRVGNNTRHITACTTINFLALIKWIKEDKQRTKAKIIDCSKLIAGNGKASRTLVIFYTNVVEPSLSLSCRSQEQVDHSCSGRARFTLKKNNGKGGRERKRIGKRVRG